MENNGNWIKLNRKILDHPISKDSDYAWCWIYLLLRANYQDIDILIGNNIIHLKRGQFLTSRKTINKDTNIEESKIERILKLLENEHQIEQLTNRQYRIITIVKYDYYQNNEQVSEQQMNNERTTNEQRMNTDKNIKKEKNEKKDIGDKSPTPSQIMKNFLNPETDEQDKQVKRLIENFRLDEKYIWDELGKFIDYWEETTKSGIKQRWELEKTWNLERRLDFWINQSLKYNKNKKF